LVPSKAGAWVWTAWFGVAPWCVGVFFEAIGDRQMERYGPTGNKGGVIDVGLWRYTAIQTTSGRVRLVGIFLVAADQLAWRDHNLWPHPDDPVAYEGIRCPHSRGVHEQAAWVGRLQGSDERFIPLPPRKPRD